MDDLVLEMEESFIVVLNRTSQLDSRISLEPTTAEIVIVDDDGRWMQEHVCSYHNTGTLILVTTNFSTTVVM